MRFDPGWHLLALDGALAVAAVIVWIVVEFVLFPIRSDRKM